MFKCDCYPNHNICKNREICELGLPLNEKLEQIYGQLSYELNILKGLKQRKMDYFEILSEIRQQRYTEILLIDGRLQRVPKLNARGEYILEPGDVQVGLNYNVISQEIIDTETIIRELRRKEHNILKIFKKRAGKYD